MRCPRSSATTPCYARRVSPSDARCSRSQACKRPPRSVPSGHSSRPRRPSVTSTQRRRAATRRSQATERCRAERRERFPPGSPLIRRVMPASILSAHAARWSRCWLMYVAFTLCAPKLRFESAFPLRVERFVDEALVQLVRQLLPIFGRERQQLAAQLGPDRHSFECTRRRNGRRSHYSPRSVSSV